jgi:hypothetical protein
MPYGDDENKTAQGLLAEGKKSNPKRSQKCVSNCTFLSNGAHKFIHVHAAAAQLALRGMKLRHSMCETMALGEEREIRLTTHELLHDAPQEPSLESVRANQIG